MSESIIYLKWKKIMAKMVANKIDSTKAMVLLINNLKDNNISLMPNHDVHAVSFLFGVKKTFNQINAPVGMGLLYLKPDNTYTQDIFIADPNKQKIQKFYSDKRLNKKYPQWKNAHKKEL